jgi:hypothetical protein
MAADKCSSNAARQAVYKLANLGKAYRTNPDEYGKGAVAIYDLTDTKSSKREPPTPIGAGILPE